MIDTRLPTTPAHAYDSLSDRPEPLPSRERDLLEEVTLLELLDRVLDKGIVLAGDITLSVADVDLVYVGLRALLSSVEAARRQCPAGDSAQQPADPPTPVP